MRLVQYEERNGNRRVARVSDDGRQLHPLSATERIYDLALEADRRGVGLEQLVADREKTDVVDYAEVVAQNRLWQPLDHPDPAHCILSGTGLDHLGSAQARNAMHAKLDGDEGQLTDSMRMFKLGLEGGKPQPGQIGAAPEWFYKGDGRWVARPGHSLELPAYADDGGEEPELIGLYVIGESGRVLRVGFALGNEFSDHVLEKQNYLYLAHSKLRQSSFGPEVLLGEPPPHIEGNVRIERDGQELWSATFLTGEANMTHSLANLEHHHFKYAPFRVPGDVHCHFFGTATLSFAAGIQTQPGDLFEISASNFGHPLRNPLVQSDDADQLVTVNRL